MFVNYLLTIALKVLASFRFFLKGLVRVCIKYLYYCYTLEPDASVGFSTNRYCLF